MPFRRAQEGGDLCAIFVHAGAGYHSHQNEKVHLSAVNDAAKVAMTVLKNGGDATDAVEIAIRLLEDREITNAGYGSNLTMDGYVECDATLVDHYGRSGAVGAVSQVKNPIALARIVLNESTKPLSLQRVPPNLLVGLGATRFAADFGLPILPYDFLISDGAKERWIKWRQDLIVVRDEELKEQEKAKRKAQSQFETPELVPTPTGSTASPAASSCDQTDCPVSISDLPVSQKPLLASAADLPTSTFVAPAFPASPVHDANGNPQEDPDDIEVGVDDSPPWITSPAKRQKRHESFDGSGTPGAVGNERDATKTEYSGNNRNDHITDTVGAIAIDCFGNIAAGSSSGGIGMKHAGRCGPAALVGIGTAVVPADPQDPERICVATVTSGTGEHMATTTAAATAADRIYHSVRKERGKIKSCSEDEAMTSIIKNDFMRHPGVRNSHCAGAIGILAVKKTRDGIYFYFGHNTDSFVLASMHSEERNPVCTMSRGKGNASVAQGGRVSRSKYSKRR